MTKCEPAKKGSKTSAQPCFRCIRDVPARSKYDFVDECASDVMLKMDEEELAALAQEVLQAVLDVDTYETDWDELILLGDCLARVYMHTLTRGRELNKMFEKYENVEEVIRIAAEKSMPANGIVSMYEKNTSFPKCWLAAHRS